MATLNIQPNALFTADNLYVLNGMNSECIDLIYLDPPFNSKRLYKAPVGSKAAGAAFEDMWSWKDVDSALMVRLSETHPFLVDYITAIERIHSKAMMAYIAYMAQRLFEMYRVLKTTGSIYLHCDPTASHYLKVVLDRIFGKNNFRNELVWHYKGASMTAAAKIYPRKHDVILFYTKSETYTFNPPRQSELSDVMKQRWGKYLESDGKSILWKSIKNEPGQVRKFLGKLTKQLGRPPRDDDVAWVANPSLVRSVWVDLPEVRNNPKYLESTGYPTQKPLKLLQRIISASSNEGDVVLDPFCGCATTCVAAQHLHRRWIGIDISETTGDLIRDRLKDDVGALFDDFGHFTDLPDRKDVKPMSKRQAKPLLYGDQAGDCNGCKRHFEIHDFHVDHIIPSSKGGGDFYANYQLLCGNCNSIKGNRPMEYLVKAIEARKAKRAVFGATPSSLREG